MSVHSVGGWLVAGGSENAVIIQLVAEAKSPEEAARRGRQHQRLHPTAVRPDWDQAKLQVMLAAVRAKVHCLSAKPMLKAALRA